MPRVRLRRQPHYEFSYKKTLTFRDINYGGHLGNDAVVAIAQEARIALLRQLGGREKDLGDGRTGIIMIDLAVMYSAEGYQFDELEVLSHIGETTDTAFRIFQHFVRGEDTVATVESGFVGYDYGSHSVERLPAIFLQRVQAWAAEHPAASTVSVRS